MTRIPFQVVAFDLDGTLADTSPDLTAALNHVLTQLSRPSLPVEEVIGLVGHGARALIRKGLAVTGGGTEDMVDEAYPAFLDHYASNICTGTRSYPGVEAALDALLARETALAICTNKPEALALQLVEALGWKGRFRSIIGGDTLPVRKPDPAPLHEAIARAGGGSAVFIGDSITDADTARAAAIPLVAVSFGFSDRPVSALGADAV
ncbi:MAG TPA: phosphoglycolate phosphatase, partial [Allosphingosinicella sp.]